MTRRARRTEPLETREGLLTSYAEIEPRLAVAEGRGRVWCFERSANPTWAGSVPTVVDILGLHQAMFSDLVDWAGEPRTDERGPGGKVPVSYWQVRSELHKLCGDLACWCESARSSDLEALARVIADAHHRFQWIHPFQDTNGRTGRVLDHYLLWITFGLSSTTLMSSPTLVYFPDAAAEDTYYAGLQEADGHRPDKLQQFYLDRLTAAFTNPS